MDFPFANILYNNVLIPRILKDIGNNREQFQNDRFILQIYHPLKHGNSNHRQTKGLRRLLSRDFSEVFTMDRLKNAYRTKPAKEYRDGLL
jgi:hypothetical protein